MTYFKNALNNQWEEETMSVLQAEIYHVIFNYCFLIFLRISISSQYLANHLTSSLPRQIAATLRL